MIWSSIISRDDWIIIVDFTTKDLEKQFGRLVLEGSVDGWRGRLMWLIGSDGWCGWGCTNYFAMVS